MDLGLQGRVALVTGGSKGIGLGIARRLAAEGCALHLVSRTTADLEAARADLTGRHGVPVSVYAMDMAERGAAEALGAKCGDLDILVNNAGATPRGALDEVDEERWRRAFDLKVFGYINLCRAFYPRMKARRRGVIINIIGNGGERGLRLYRRRRRQRRADGFHAYSARSIDWRARGGRESTLVATERLVGLMQKEAEGRYGDSGRWREFEKGFPLGRSATPDEVAATIARLIFPPTPPAPS
jgi:NAD(P)-dependent dehydrogenase (short-subunit alcohol dehydrogenase family)